MTKQTISHGEKSLDISHGEKKPVKKRKKYDLRKVSKRELKLRESHEKLRLRVRYLEFKYKPMDDGLNFATQQLISRNGKPLPFLGVECRALRWVEREDVIDYAAGFFLCHPTSRYFRVLLNSYNLYGRIQDAMRSSEWPAIIAKAMWVREFAGWRHPPADGPYDEARWMERQVRSISVVSGTDTACAGRLAA